jgi:hypothetical protein
VTRRRRDYTRVSVFRRHLKLDDETLIRLVYFFCNGIGIDSAARRLGLSRKTVRGHYFDLRRRLVKPKFRRWHRVYSALGVVADQAKVYRIKGGVIESLAVCYYSDCHTNYVSGNRKSRMCRSCPLPCTFTKLDIATEAIGVVDAIQSLYKRHDIRGDVRPDKVSVFFERFVHVGVLAGVRRKSKSLSNGMLDPKDTDFEGAGTLMLMLLDDMSDENNRRWKDTADPR